MANRTELRKFGTYALDSTNGVVLKSWENRQLRDTDFSPRLRGGGSIVTEDRLTGSQVSLSGVVIGVDTGAVRDRIDGLIEALSQGEDYLQIYTDRRILCRLDGPVRYDFGGLGRAYEWQARLTSRWPTWEDPTPQTNQFTPTGAGPHDLTTASIVGSAPAWPVITLQTNFSFQDRNVIITNTGTLQQLQLIGLSLNDGQAAIIDMREGFFGDGVASALLPFAIEGDWFSLSPGAVADLEIAHNVGSGADWTIDVDYRPQYWAA